MRVSAKADYAVRAAVELAAAASPPVKGESIAQAQDAMVRSQAALETALEQFRVLLGSSPTEPIEPEPLELASDLTDDSEPLETLLDRAIKIRKCLRIVTLSPGKRGERVTRLSFTFSVILLLQQGRCAPRA